MSDVIRVRKIPIEVEAMQYDGYNVAALRDWADITWSDQLNTWAVRTPEGDMKLERGVWVIKGAVGEFYLCREDIFDQTYERL